MCGHLWRELGGVRVCLRCGMTVSRLGGAVVFDRRLANIKNRKGMRANEKQSGKIPGLHG